MSRNTVVSDTQDCSTVGPHADTNESFSFLSSDKPGTYHFTPVRPSWRALVRNDSRPDELLLIPGNAPALDRVRAPAP